MLTPDHRVAEVDLFKVVVEGGDVNVQLFEGESDKASFFLVSGAISGQSLDLHLFSKTKAPQGIVIEYMGGNVVARYEIPCNRGVVHEYIVQGDKSSVSFEAWPTKDNGIEKRTMVIVFDTSSSQPAVRIS